MHESRSIGFDYEMVLETEEILHSRFGQGGDDSDGGSEGEDDFFAGDGLQFGTNNNNILITGRQKGVDVVKELKNLCLEHDEGASLENLAIEVRFVRVE